MTSQRIGARTLRWCRQLHFCHVFYLIKGPLTKTVVLLTVWRRYLLTRDKSLCSFLCFLSIMMQVYGAIQTSSICTHVLPRKRLRFAALPAPFTPNSIRQSMWLFSQRKMRKCVRNVLVEHEQFPAGERAWRSGWVATGSKVNSKSLRNPKLRKNLHYHLASENSLKLYVTADTSQRHLPTESLE